MPFSTLNKTGSCSGKPACNSYALKAFDSTAFNALALAIFIGLPTLVLGADEDLQLDDYNTTFLQGAQSNVDLKLLLAADSEVD